MDRSTKDFSNDDILSFFFVNPKFVKFIILDFEFRIFQKVTKTRRKKRERGERKWNGNKREKEERECDRDR